MIHNSYKQSTIISYYRTINKFKDFLAAYGAAHSLPASSHTISLYVSYLCSLVTPTSSIRSQVSALGWWHRMNGHPDPTANPALKRQIEGNHNYHQLKEKLHPIDRNLLQRICNFIPLLNFSNYSKIALKSILLLMYHACMRIGEAVTSGPVDHSLKRNNISFTLDSPPVLVITFESYKHSSSRKIFHLRPSAHPSFCPVYALTDYLKIRSNWLGPLFVDPQGVPLKRAFVANGIKQLIQYVGLDPALFNTHSLRIGRTTDLAKEGTPLEVIKETGRWSSDAYTNYIRFPSFTLPA